MCTLIVGVHVAGPGTLLLGANRDESPERATLGPGVLVERPRIVGGRDLLSGGTWLAVREGRFVSALLNRRPLSHDHRDPSTLRSRGLLCLDAAAAGPPLGSPLAIDPGTGESRPRGFDAALRLLHSDAYAHCTLVGLEENGGWAIHAGHGAAPEVAWISDGWHVLTHQELDDITEPRTRRLLDQLGGVRPGNLDEAFELLARLLRGHGDSGGPPVCLHRERFPTVSSTLISIGPPERRRYLHAEGPPCVTPYLDHSDLLA